MANQKNVLIVDDSAVTRILLKGTMIKHKNDWNILEASNGLEALKVLEENKIDMISIDYNMPGMDGLELVEIVKEKYPTVKIAILTANVQDAFREKVNLYSVEFLEKPITDETIKRLIQICLN